MESGEGAGTVKVQKTGIAEAIWRDQAIPPHKKPHKTFGFFDLSFMWRDRLIPPDGFLAPEPQMGGKKLRLLMDRYKHLPILNYFYFYLLQFIYAHNTIPESPEKS